MVRQAQIRSEVQDSAVALPGANQDLLGRLQRSFTLAQEVGQIGCYEIDMRDGSTLATPCFFEHYGLPPEQGRMSRSEWLAYVHPEDRAWVLEHLGAFAASQGVSDLEYRIVRADGDVRWITARTRLERDETGEARWAYGVQQDITDRKRGEDVLRESELRFRTVAEQASDLIYSYDVDAGTLEWFGDVDAIFGYPPGLFPRTIQAWEAHVHPDDRLLAAEALETYVNGGAPFSIEYRTISLDGSTRYWIDRGTMMAEWGNRRIMVGAMTDVTEQRRTVHNLAESEARFRHLADHLPVMVWLSGAGGGISFVSKRWEDFTGRPTPEGLGRGWVESVHPDDQDYVVQLLEALTAQREPYQLDYRMIRHDSEVRWVMGIGVPRYNPDGEFLGFAGSLIDITERKLAEQQAAWSADHDSLTGLANRASFQRELRTGLALAKAAEMRAAVILFDLDHLKLVNDRLGHDAGDALIRAVAQRLSDAVGLRGVVARLGGDEFGVLLLDVASRADAAEQAAGLSELLCQPVAHGGSNLDCRGSVGFSLFPDDSRCPDKLLKNADLALYEAKARRGGSVIAYQPAFRSELRQRARVSEDAGRFLADHRIVPYYQPRIDLATGAVAGFEALLRMRSANGRVQLPGRIMSAFEEPGLAIALGERMLDRVLADIKAWLDAGQPFVRVAINASELEFRSGGYSSRVLGALERAGVPPCRLEIEVTETVFVNRQTSLINDELAALNKAGVLIALDDFGTGYASLTHLRRFPVDIIKIDRSFVADINDDDDDRAIVQAILGLGQSLGKVVIAEGVETEAQADWLRGQGCKLAQGYLFARPMPATRAIALAARRQT